MPLFGSQMDRGKEGATRARGTTGTRNFVLIVSHSRAAIRHEGGELILNGERGRNRTYNLVIKSHLLCQLSYAPGWDCDLDLADAGRLANSPNIARPARK